MMDEAMNKYKRQMDQVTLSEAADQRILKDLLEADAQKKVSYMGHARRSLSTAAMLGLVVLASSVTVLAGVIIHGTIIKSKKAEAPVEGVGAHVDVGNSYYYDLFADTDGTLYALTDNDYDQLLTTEHMLVWKSTDQADSWESVLAQPEELKEDAYISAGDLYKGNEGIEALVLFEQENSDDHARYLYQIRADGYEKIDLLDAFAEAGEHLFNVKYVNDDVIALVGTEECFFYDMHTQSIVKTLPYDLDRGCLLTKDYFILYGQDIYSCVDRYTLEEKEPDSDLTAFVRTMFAYNDRSVFPQMEESDDTIVCVTKRGIYEYQEGVITKVKLLTGTAMDDGRAYNGLMPMCKGQDGKYYVCKFSDYGMTLWQVDPDSEKMK